MKIVVYLFTVFIFFAFVNAQASYIRLPITRTNFKIGRKFTVQVVRPNSIQGSTEVGIAIGLRSCKGSPCPSASAQFGLVLYHGQYNPTLHEIPGNPYENFTVTVPDLPQGSAQLNVVRLHLIGAGASAATEFNQVPVVISA